MLGPTKQFGLSKKKHFMDLEKRVNLYWILLESRNNLYMSWKFGSGTASKIDGKTSLQVYQEAIKCTSIFIGPYIV